MKKGSEIWGVFQWPKSYRSETRLLGHRPRFNMLGLMFMLSRGKRHFKQIQIFKTAPFKAWRQLWDKCKTQIVGNLWTQHRTGGSLKRQKTQDAARSLLRKSALHKINKGAPLIQLWLRVSNPTIWPTSDDLWVTSTPRRVVWRRPFELASAASVFKRIISLRLTPSMEFRGEESLNLHMWLKGG